MMKQQKQKPRASESEGEGECEQGEEKQWSCRFISKFKI